jgi:hypothetical protein
VASYGKTRLGIALTATGGEAALVRLRGKRRKPKLLASAQSDVALGRFEAGDPDIFASVFKELAKGLPNDVRRADMPVFVSLPDALVREDVLQFADFPQDVIEAQDLIRLRLLRDGDGALQDPICTYQVIARGDRVTVRTRSIERSLRDAVEAGARAGGLHISRMDGWFGFASAALDGVADNGACVLSDGQSWSLACWAPDTPEGFYESGWIDSSGDALGERTTRLVQSFALRHKTKALTLVAAAPTALLPQLSSDIFGKTIDGTEVLAAAPTPAQGVAQWG